MTKSEGSFPITKLSLIRDLASAHTEVRRRAWETVIAAYWKPTYKYIRTKYARDAAETEDLTQDFFARVFEKDFFIAYDPERARFRTFLRVCLDRFVINELKARSRIKRGGGVQLVSLDFTEAERELTLHGSTAAASPERYFELEWVRSIIHLALTAVRDQAKKEHKELAYHLFEQYDVEREGPSPRPTYRQLAQEHDVPITDVTNHLAEMRRKFREAVLEIIRGLTADEEEFKQEVRSVLGIEPQ